MEELHRSVNGIREVFVDEIRRGDGGGHGWRCECYGYNTKIGILINSFGFFVAKRRQVKISHDS